MWTEQMKTNGNDNISQRRNALVGVQTFARRCESTLHGTDEDVPF